MSVNVKRSIGNVVLLAAVAGAVHCTDDSSPLNVVPTTPAHSNVVSGTNQSARVASTLSEPLTVLVTDEYGNPVPGATVRFELSSDAGQVAPQTATTDRAGRAQATWTLGTTAGVDSLRALVAGVEQTVFTAVVEPGPPATVQTVSGDDQTAAPRMAVPEFIIVRVEDAYGNGVPGATVQWEITRGDGSVDPRTTLTDSAGLASTEWILGPVLRDTNTVVARVGALASPPFEAVSIPPFNLSIAAAYITQAAQNLQGRVPLVVGRPGYLRVFGVANETNELQPDVEVRWYRNGSLLAADTIPAQGFVPTAVTRLTQGSLEYTWNLPVPASRITSGLEVLFTIDPADEVLENDETDNSYPKSGQPLQLDVRVAPTFRARLIPIYVPGIGATGNVSASNKDMYLSDAWKMFPFPDYDVDVHAPFTSSVSNVSERENWSVMIGEIRALRMSEGSTRYYYGVVPFVEPALCGLGYYVIPVAIGADSRCGSGTAAHEWGHNFDRRHTPCGGPDNPDPNYPYANASIGIYGMDVFTGDLKPPSYHDLMSYCDPAWISDYTYRAVLDYRFANTATSTMAFARTPSILIWGRIHDGRAVLEPAFRVTTRPRLPSRPGPYTVQGFDASGSPLFSLSFTGARIAHMPADVRSFAFAVPIGVVDPDQIVELRLSGPGFAPVTRTRNAVLAAAPPPTANVRRISPRHLQVRWDPESYPMLLVRHPRTGEVLSFARGGSATILTEVERLDVQFSGGIKVVERAIDISN